MSMQMFDNAAAAQQLDHPVIVLPMDFVPNDSDVICQRGKDFFDHEGNRRFRSFVDKKIQNYMKATTRQEKAAIINTIFHMVRKGAAPPHGGFVKKDLLTQRWHQICEKDAKDKVAQALRDAIKNVRAAKKAQKQKNSDNASEKKAAPNKKKRTHNDSASDDHMTNHTSSLPSLNNPIGSGGFFGTPTTGAAVARPAPENDFFSNFSLPPQGLMLQSSIEPLPPGTLQQHQEQFENELKRQLYPMGNFGQSLLGGGDMNPNLSKRARLPNNQTVEDSSRRSSLIGSFSEVDGAFPGMNPNLDDTTLPLDWGSAFFNAAAKRVAEGGGPGIDAAALATPSSQQQQQQQQQQSSQLLRNSQFVEQQQDLNRRLSLAGLAPMFQPSFNGLGNFPFDFEPNPFDHNQADNSGHDPNNTARNK